MSLLHEVDELSMLILKLVNGTSQSSSSPAPRSAEVKDVSPIRPTAEDRVLRTAQSPQRGRGEYQDRIAAILLPPGSQPPSLVRFTDHQGAYPRASPAESDQLTSSDMRQQIATNLTRLLYSAAALEFESRPSPRRGQNLSETSPRDRVAPQSTEERSATLPPSPRRQRGRYAVQRTSESERYAENTFVSETATTSSTGDSSTLVSTNDLQGKVHRGREQTKELIHELHLLEVRMNEKLKAQKAAHDHELEQWNDERRRQNDEIASLRGQIDASAADKQQILRLLQEANNKRAEVGDELRDTTLRFAQLEKGHGDEIESWKKQCQLLRGQLARMREQRDAAERNMTFQGRNYSEMVDKLTKAEARIHVLQTHIHEMHVRDHHKDVHLRDVAEFMKSSLAPFVYDLEEGGVLGHQCSRCAAQRLTARNSRSSSTRR